MTELATMNDALNALGHCGLQVTIFDDEIITSANLGRQRFAKSEVGLYKSVGLINRCNRFFGTHWNAITQKFEIKSYNHIGRQMAASIFISCVDTVNADIKQPKWNHNMSRMPDSINNAWNEASVIAVTLKGEWYPDRRIVQSMNSEVENGNTVIRVYCWDGESIDVPLQHRLAGSSENE